MHNFNRTIAAYSTTIAAFFLYLCVIPYSFATGSATIMVGGALNTCSSYSPQNCVSGKVPAGKQRILYQANEAALNRLAKNFRFLAAQKESKTTLNALYQRAEKLAAAQPGQISYSALKAAWNAQGALQFHQLSDAVFYALTDSLEVAQHTEQVSVSDNRSEAASQIVSAIGAATLKYASKAATPPSILVITAAGRDPYESADFYQQLLQFEQVRTQWLPLTPALVEALHHDDCANLEQYRQKHHTFARQYVYPERTAQEARLCQAGAQALVDTIEKATTVMFNGGDQSLTRKVLFDNNGAPYRWAEALRTRPVIAGTSAGTAIQSGGHSKAGPVPMISNGSVIQALIEGAIAAPPPSQRCYDTCNQALHPDSLTYHTQGGLGRITNAIMDTHFSERGRSVRLHVLARDTRQVLGYGVDETTALMLTEEPAGPAAQVLGAHGVVKIKPIDEQAFGYSFYPAGAALSVNQGEVVLAGQTDGITLSKDDKVPLLSQQLLDGKTMRDATQQLCRQQLPRAKGSHTAQSKRWLFEFDATEATMLPVSSAPHGCAIENLKVRYQRVPAS